MSPRHKTLSITLRDLRIAKLDRRTRINPCTAELEAFLNALSNYDEGKVPLSFSKALSDCMDQKVPKVRPASVQFHLSKFVK